MRIVSVAIFITIALSLIFGIHYLLWVRLIRDPSWPLGTTRALTWALIALGSSLPLVMIVSRFIDGPVARAFAWFGFAWMGVMATTLVVVLIGEVLRIPLLWSTVDPDRRALFGRVLAIAGGSIASGLGIYGIAQALSALRVKDLSITLDRLPPSLDGLKIVQVTDIHVGSTIRRAFIEEMVAKINALAPDVVCITGDLMDGSVTALAAEVAPLASIRSKYGVFFVTGNHEYYSGAQEWVDHLPSLGIKVLRNERVSIGDDKGSFDLAGIDDWTAHQFGHGHGADLPRALNERDTSRELVLMAHQPKAVTEAASFGVGLQLSGHTHGGQLWPWTHAVRFDTPYVLGLYKVGPTQLYVSPGTGYWGPPMRIGTRAEITQLTLRSAMAVA